MQVSVIVSTYTEKRYEDLIACFDSIKQQTIQPLETLLVLDPDPELVEYYTQRVPPFVKIITSTEKGLSNARNAGIDESNGEIIAFIDDDAYADPHWIEKIIENYQDPNVVGVGGQIIPHWESTEPSWFPKEFYWIVGCSYSEVEKKREVRNPIGANMSFRKNVFEKAGKFRTDIGRYGKMLLSGEEAELSLKILNQIPDSKMIYEPEAIVYHRVPAERIKLQYILKRAYYEGVSKGIIAKHEKSGGALSTEQGYLKQLLTKLIPSKLRTIYRWTSISQIIITLILITMVFLGYIRVRFI
jgi:glycosyltransferase involved in cell wall biosynthesis